MTELTEELQKRLRSPFPPEKIGQIPRGGRRLDFVGHADVTDRLLEVDPEWTWEPLALDDDGTPRIHWNEDRAVMWIRLRVCGIVRPGVGTVDIKGSELDVEKELISDAIRNAAMRFGVALDLWSGRGEVRNGSGGAETATERASVRPASSSPPKATGLQVGKIKREYARLGDWPGWFYDEGLHPLDYEKLSKRDASALIDRLVKEEAPPKAERRGPVPNPEDPEEDPF